MQLTDKQKQTIKQIVSIFETGKIEGDYGAVATYNDGPDHQKQITYGAHQLTESAGLKSLLTEYCNNNGVLKREISSHLNKVGDGELVDNEFFKSLLRSAGHDPVMQKVQDEYFDKKYYQKALTWANFEGFTLPLSMAVIYDSFIHSGGILSFLRKRFEEVTPVKGGDEQKWLKAYIMAREQWLKNSSDPILRNTTYRPITFLRLIQEGKWNLELPIIIRNLELK